MTTLDAPAWMKDWAGWKPDPRRFQTYRQWINKAATWVAGGTCVDANGRVLRIGADFMDAAYPVTIMRKASPHLMSR